MKLQSRQIEAFLKAPEKDIRAILVYGPDQGLVRERSKILALTQLPDINDPFNAAHLTGDVIEEDPPRLSDEANAGSLMGGKRLVRITEAGNGISIALKAWLKNDPSQDCLVVIEAGDLKPKDSLRKVCEDLENSMALPCYIEDERALESLIKDNLRQHNLTIAADAASYLANVAKGDRARVRMEIEKLLLYAQGAKEKVKTITLQDVQQSCGEIGLYSLDDLVYAVTGGNRELSLKAARALFDEGSEPIVLMRSLQNHLLRFHQVKSLMELHNQSLEDSMKSLQPPVFFKTADLFKAQIRNWPARKTRSVLMRLADLENRSKQTGTPTETLLHQFILSIAA